MHDLTDIAKVGTVSRLSILSILMLLAGCSQTTVHLNARYLNDTQTQQVIDALTANNISVRINANRFPQHVTRSTVIYSPTMQARAPHRIDDVYQVMKKAGWDLQNTDIFLRTNHRYTGNNVGIYLIPDGVSIGDSWSMQRIANEFHSLECGFDHRLALNANGSFILQGVDSSTVLFEGSWELKREPYIRLFQDEPRLNFYYQIEDERVMNAQHPDRIITLSPLSDLPHFPDCDFTVATRSD